MMGRKSKRRISASDLIRIFQEVNKKSYVKKTLTSSTYDFTLAIPFLKENGLDGHICFRSFERGLPRNSERRIYDWISNIIIRNLIIEFDTHLEFGNRSDWTPLSDAKWHFEECKIEPLSPNTGNIYFPWMRNFRFYKNEFSFDDSAGARTWLFGFGVGSWVLFQKNDFKNSSIQIVYSSPDDDSKNSSVQKLSWKGREAYITEDDSYYEAMIRKKYQLPETVKLNIPDAHSRHIGLGALSFLENKGIDHLNLRCNAASYVFRGINHIGISSHRLERTLCNGDTVGRTEGEP